MRLEKDNAHPRDARIEFNEAEHFYTVDSRRVVGSCSSLWASCFSRFDADAAARRLVDRHGKMEPRDDANADDALWKWRYAYAYETLVNRTSAAEAVRALEDRGCSSFDFSDADKGYRRLLWHVRATGVKHFDSQVIALKVL